jgi:protein TonB
LLCRHHKIAARDAGIQGTVMVMARVLADGTVGETSVMKSTPALDDAAIQAVKRMRFKPASLQGRPVASWVGVPVRFTLH